jgi:hypothetical protein
MKTLHLTKDKKGIIIRDDANIAGKDQLLPVDVVLTDAMRGLKIKIWVHISTYEIIFILIRNIGHENCLKIKDYGCERFFSALEVDSTIQKALATVKKKYPPDEHQSEESLIT